MVMDTASGSGVFGLLGREFLGFWVGSFCSPTLLAPLKALALVQLDPLECNIVDLLHMYNHILCCL